MKAKDFAAVATKGRAGPGGVDCPCCTPLRAGAMRHAKEALRRILRRKENIATKQLITD